MTIVKLLLTNNDGINPNTKVANDQTLLLWAAKNGYEAVVKILLVKDGIDLNFKDKDSRTPLL